MNITMEHEQKYVEMRWDESESQNLMFCRVQTQLNGVSSDLRIGFLLFSFHGRVDNEVTSWP